MRRHSAVAHPPTPITFTERLTGESKMSGSIVRESLARVTRWGLERRAREMRELFLHHRRLPSVRTTQVALPH